MTGVSIRQQISNMEEGTILFRSDFPMYNVESVGNMLSELVKENVITKLSQGIYLKPRKSKFGNIYPTIDEIVASIANRDKCQILPCGATAELALGLSTQVPMSYTYLTSGSARTIVIDNKQIILKRSVPRSFSYKTMLMSLLVQALKSIGEHNLGEQEMLQIQALFRKEEQKELLKEDISTAPIWMRKILIPIYKNLMK